MQRKVFVFNPELRVYLSRALEKENVTYRFLDDNRVEVDCSGNQFHYIVMAARAAKESEDTGILHVSHLQLQRKGALAALKLEFVSPVGPRYGFCVI